MKDLFGRLQAAKEIVIQMNSLRVGGLHTSDARPLDEKEMKVYHVALDLIRHYIADEITDDTLIETAPL